MHAAPALTRPLLLMHGLANTNVHPLHTLRLSNALLAAGRPHEVLLLPAGHQAIGAAGTEGLLRHQAASCSSTSASNLRPHDRPAAQSSTRGLVIAPPASPVFTVALGSNIRICVSPLATG